LLSPLYDIVIRARPLKATKFTSVGQSLDTYSLANAHSYESIRAAAVYAKLLRPSVAIAPIDPPELPLGINSFPPFLPIFELPVFESLQERLISCGGRLLFRVTCYEDDQSGIPFTLDPRVLTITVSSITHAMIWSFYLTRCVKFQFSPFCHLFDWFGFPGPVARVPDPLLHANGLTSFDRSILFLDQLWDMFKTYKTKFTSIRELRTTVFSTMGHNVCFCPDELIPSDLIRMVRYNVPPTRPDNW